LKISGAEYELKEVLLLADGRGTKFFADSKVNMRNLRVPAVASG
jgi:hypothetical protein